jgi:hypothetical protein
MHDSKRMNVGQGLKQLFNNNRCYVLIDHPMLNYLLIHLPSTSQLSNQVEIVIILEILEHPDNVWMR